MVPYFQLGEVSPVHSDILIAKMRPGQVRLEMYRAHCAVSSTRLVVITLLLLGD